MKSLVGVGPTRWGLGESEALVAVDRKSVPGLGGGFQATPGQVLSEKSDRDEGKKEAPARTAARREREGGANVDPRERVCAG